MHKDANRDMNPIRIQFNQACELLNVSRESLRHIIRTDEKFPRPIKNGNAKQAPVYFDYGDILSWHEEQKLNSQYKNKNK